MYEWRNNISTGEPEIAISGWERGIADSPHLGIANMRNINNDSQPGIALCNQKLVQNSQTTISAKAFTVDVPNSQITWTGTPILSGSPVVFAGSDLPAPLGAGTIYFLAVAGNTSTIYSDPYLNTQVVLSDAGSGTMTFSTKGIGQIKDWTKDKRTGYIYVIDEYGYVWFTTGTNWTVLTGATYTDVSGNGICVYKDYLFVFRNYYIDVYGSLNAVVASRAWTLGWKTMNTTAGQSYSHHAIAGQDDIMYFCDSRYIGSIKENVSKTFAPGDATTYTYNNKALTLPSGEITSWFDEHIVNLVIGTSTSNMLYPWDRTSTSFTVPIPLPEVGVSKILNINRILYVLAGERGNIYYSNGTTTVLFKTIPKHILGGPYETVTWGGIMSLNNNLCVGISSTSCSGVIAIQLFTGELGQTIAGALRYKGQPSNGAELPSVLIPFNDGIRYYSFAGDSGSAVIDKLSLTTFYSAYESYIETDIIPIGTALQPRTFNTVEFKLDTALINGEKIKISARSELSDTYVEIMEIEATATSGEIDGSAPLTIELGKWIQIKVELQTVDTSTRSYARLKEIILR